MIQYSPTPARSYSRNLSTRSMVTLPGETNSATRVGPPCTFQTLPADHHIIRIKIIGKTLDQGTKLFDQAPIGIYHLLERGR